MRTNALRHVARRVGPGSALRSGRECGPSGGRAAAPRSFRSLVLLFTRSGVGPQSPSVSPDKAREGRRSGAHCDRSRVKILMRTNALRHVARRVGPGSPLTLRPGMRPFGGRAAAPRTFRSLVLRVAGHEVGPRSPSVSPDKAHEGRRSGAHGDRSRVKNLIRTKALRNIAGGVGPSSALRSGRECGPSGGGAPAARSFRSLVLLFTRSGVGSQSPSVSPDKAREGRRSGAYSHHSRVKILMKTKALRHVAGEWVPALRCAPAGNAAFSGVVRPLPELSARWSSASRVAGLAPDLRAHPRTRRASAADPGPTRIIAASKS